MKNYLSKANKKRIVTSIPSFVSTMLSVSVFKFFSAAMMMLLSAAVSVAQPSASFLSPGIQVIAYKSGTKKSGTFMYSRFLLTKDKSETAIRLAKSIVYDRAEVIVAPNTARTTYRIVNTTGVVLKKGRFTNTPNSVISVKELKPGWYFLVLDGKQAPVRFMKI